MKNLLKNKPDTVNVYLYDNALKEIDMQLKVIKNTNYSPYVTHKINPSLILDSGAQMLSLPFTPSEFYLKRKNVYGILEYLAENKIISATEYYRINSKGITNTPFAYATMQNTNGNVLKRITKGNIALMKLLQKKGISMIEFNNGSILITDPDVLSNSFKDVTLVDGSYVLEASDMSIPSTLKDSGDIQYAEIDPSITSKNEIYNEIHEATFKRMATTEVQLIDEEDRIKFVVLSLKTLIGQTGRSLNGMSEEDAKEIIDIIVSKGFTINLANPSENMHTNIDIAFLSYIKMQEERFNLNREYTEKLNLAYAAAGNTFGRGLKVMSEINNQVDPLRKMLDQLGEY